MLTTLCCALFIAGADTVQRPLSGPTADAARAGMSAPIVDRRAVPQMRRVNGQLAGGLIGAGVLATIAVLVVKAFEGQSEREPPSIVLTAAGAAFGGFVIGALVAGPD